MKNSGAARDKPILGKLYGTLVTTDGETLIRTVGKDIRVHVQGRRPAKDTAQWWDLWVAMVACGS